MSTSETADGSRSVWQDFQSGYVPSEPLDVPDSLPLHDEFDRQLDPVTYEVLRHRLWTLNEEHGRILENVSGSPVAYFGQDFNTSLHAADGELIFGAAYVQLFAPIAELIIQWCLENRSRNPGINPGDIFLNNDPWIGSTQQPDVFFVAPVFHEGSLFCWLSNALHQYDIGGIDPGGICPSAENVHMEPTPIPPIKVVEGGEVRQDLRQMYMRHSRLPRLLGLDFNAQVAGLRATVTKVQDLIEKHGPRVVKGTMEKIVTDSETSFLEKLEEIPDGTWRARAHMDGSKTGDNQLYTARLELTKRGDHLTFSNQGTAANKNAMNITYAGFRTALSCALNPLMMYDQLWITSGAYRHTTLDLEPGTFNCAEYPSGVSCGGSTIEFTISLVFDVVNRMISSSEVGRDDIIADPLEGLITVSQAGMDQWGNPFGTMNLDVMGTGFGARTDRDGIDVGGVMFSPQSPLPNVENNEQDYPMLYLYRREAEDSGGAGEYRGGAGMEAGWVPHKTDEIQTGVVAIGGVVPNTRGIASYPGAPVRCRSVEDSDARQQFNGEQLPQDLRSLQGDLVHHPPKSNFVQDYDEVVESRAPGASGYGDPLKRDPERVLVDYRKNLISRKAAREIYGVILEEKSGRIRLEESATQKRRSTLREQRLTESHIPATG